MSARLAVCLVALAVCVGATQAQQQRSGGAIAWLATNPDTTTAAALLKTVYDKPELPANARLTLLVPTNKVRLGGATARAAGSHSAQACATRGREHKPRTSARPRFMLHATQSATVCVAARVCAYVVACVCMCCVAGALAQGTCF
jgi:hypothetical protein